MSVLFALVFVYAAISSFDELSEVLSKFVSTSDEEGSSYVPGTMTTKDLEVIVSSTTRLHATLSDMRAQLSEAADMEQDKRDPGKWSVRFYLLFAF